MFKKLLKRSFYIFFKSCYYCRYLLVKKASLDKTWQKTDRIMLCAASGIGDAVMAMPVIAVLQQTRPNCRIGVVCRAPNHTLFSSMKIDVVLQYELPENQLGALIRLIKGIRCFCPDIWLALRPSNTLFHTTLAIFSGAAVRIRHALPPEKKTEADMAFVYTYIHPFYPEKHQIQNNLNLIKYFQSDISANAFLPSVTLTAQTRTAASLKSKGIVPASNWICIHAGGNRSEKRYPPHLYACVINNLIEKGYTILLLGGDADRDINQKIRAKITRKKYMDVSGQLELMQTAFVLSKSRALITNDSGIMHLADLLNVPLVVLFSPTTPQHVGPVQSNAVTLRDPENIANIKVVEILNGFEKLTDRRLARR